jgi:hypothetical protein
VGKKLNSRDRRTLYIMDRMSEAFQFDAAAPWLAMNGLRRPTKPRRRKSSTKGVSK